MSHLSFSFPFSVEDLTPVMELLVVIQFIWRSWDLGSLPIP